MQPSIARALRGLSDEHQSLLCERYSRILPALLQLMSPRDVLERNRAWPGVSPIGKMATRLIQYNRMRATRTVVHEFAARRGEDADELWVLVRTYCRYGPIGLIEALPSEAAPLLPPEITEFIAFHRLAKHPRSDGGMYIRELASEHACDLGLPTPTAYALRYAWANDQPRARWFVSDSAHTRHVTRSRRRLNMQQAYPHREWHVRIAHLPLHCMLSERHHVRIQPWVVALVDACTDECMGFRLCAQTPMLSDVLRTLRWSIWHFGTPRWISRGCPDSLLVPAPLLTNPDVESEYDSAVDAVALRYLHTHLDVSAETCTVLPPIITDALTHVPQHNLTLAEVQVLLLEYIADAWNGTAFGPLAPEILTEAGVGLPWSDSIAAARLLPSLGCYQVQTGLIHPRGIPYDLALPDGTVVEVRYNPDDARCVWAITGTARFVQATAARFEHSLPWCDLFAHSNQKGE